MAKIVFVLICTLFLSASIPSPVFAAATRGLKSKPLTLGGFSLSPMVGGYFFSEPEQRKTTPLYGLKFGYDIVGTSFVDNIGIEGTLNYFTTKLKTEANAATGYIFRLDATYPFILGDKWMPFLAVGAGMIAIDNVSKTDKNPLINYGAGLKYFFEDYLAARVDARHLFVYDNVNTRNNFEVSIGMSYYFGKERKKTPVPPKPATPAIPAIPAIPEASPPVSSAALAPLLPLESAAKPLFQASTPKVSAGEKSVLKEGSPAKVGTAVSKPGSPGVEAPIVSVGDKSVVKEGSPAKVGADVPKPVSSDHGLVAAVKIEVTSQSSPAKDEEPVRKDAAEKVVRRLWVYFDTDSSYVKPKYSKELLEIAEILKSSAEPSARIEGHTDSTGKLKHNNKLSEQRAQSVRKILMKLGVDPALISTVFYGPSRPVADNAMVEGRQKNRRVEVLATLIERSPVLKSGQEVLPGSEQEEPSEKVRLQAEKRAKASIKVAITLPENRRPLSVSGNGSLPIEISNRGENSEEFLLSVTAAKEFNAVLARANKPDDKITRLQLAAGETFKGVVTFKVPAEMTDGHRSVMVIKAVSARFNDISFQKETVLISSAPLVRAVAKLAKQKVAPGEKLRYNITILNAGSLPAQNLTVRLQLPPQVEFQGTSDVSFRQEPDNTLVFTVDQVETGKLAEINLDVKIREDSAVGLKLRGSIEVDYGNMPIKQFFTAGASEVQAK